MEIGAEVSSVKVRTRDIEAIVHTDLGSLTVTTWTEGARIRVFRWDDRWAVLIGEAGLRGKGEPVYDSRHTGKLTASAEVVHSER